MTSDGGTGHDPDPEELDELIEDILSGRAVRDRADDVTEPLLRVRALADEPLPADVRERQLTRIQTHEPAAGRRAGRRARRAPTTLRGARRRLVPLTAATVTLLLLAGGGTVAVAQDAGPDDTLYPIKRASEQVWTVIPRGSERSAEVHLALAERRLDEARRVPGHAERLVDEGLANVDAAEGERPEQAIDNFVRLLGDGPDRLPDEASPRARAALHRNCTRIATKHDLGPERCGEAPEVAHPGRGRGPGGAGGSDTRRGWGPGGRPDGELGPPHGGDVPRGHGWGPGGRPEGEAGPPHGGKGRPAADGEVPRGHGWGPGGRPEGEVGPPHGGDVPRGHGWGPGGRPEGEVGPPPGAPGSGRGRGE